MIPAATATITFFRDTGGPVTKAVNIAAGRRLTLQLNTLGFGAGEVAELANAAFSIRVASDQPILAEHGPDAVATFIGNPMGQSLSGNLYLRGYHKALGTRQLYTVGTVDQHPRSLANALLYGTQFSVPVPDLDRTDHLLVLGANPVVSQGSLVSAPDIRRRLRAIRRAAPRSSDHPGEGAQERDTRTRSHRSEAGQPPID